MYDRLAQKSKNKPNFETLQIPPLLKFNIGNNGFLLQKIDILLKECVETISKF